MFQHLKLFFKLKPARAIAVPFYLFGLLFGSWATMIPVIKEKFYLSDSELGLLLLSLPLGALVYNPTAARLIQRFGMEKVTIISMYLLILMSMIWLYTSSLLLLIFILIITGMTNSQLNIAMNLCAASIEQDNRVTIMSTCHGMFSLGLMSGAIFTSASLGFFITPFMYMLMNAGFGVLLSFTAISTIYGLSELKPPPVKEKKFKLRWPRGGLLIMVCISLCTNLTEGSMIDWASVYMKEIVKAPLGSIGWGLAAFSVLMAVGRFFGDLLIERLGRNTILFYGGMISLVGLMMILLMPFSFTVVWGFGLIGVGISCAAPILYGSSARDKSVPDGMGLAILNSFSIVGFLIGPVVIGFISQAFDLKVAFLFIGMLMVIWIVLSRKVNLGK